MVVQDERSDTERSGASATAKRGPTGQRLVSTITRIKKHPILVLISMLLAAILLTGQVVESIPTIGVAFSRIRSLFPEQQPKQDVAYSSAEGILLKAADAEPRLLTPVSDSESVVDLQWSADGTQMAALIAQQEPGEDWPSLEDRRIWYIDLMKNEEGSWPCPSCGPIVFTGHQVLTLSDGDGIHLRVFSLDSLPASPAFSGPHWGADQRREDVAAILGGGPDGLLFAVADPAGTSAQGGPQLIYRTDAAGRTAYLGQTGSYVAVGGGVTRAGGREIAVVYTEHTSACDNVDRVAVINLANNSRRELPDPESPEAWRVNSVDWSPEGQLVSVRYALSRAAKTCGEEVIGPHIARWDGEAWQRLADTEGSLVVVAGYHDALAALRKTEDTEVLQLHVRYPGDTDWTLIAAEAGHVAWRPPRTS